MKNLHTTKSDSTRAERAPYPPAPALFIYRLLKECDEIENYNRDKELNEEKFDK